MPGDEGDLGDLLPEGERGDLSGEGDLGDLLGEGERAALSPEGDRDIPGLPAHAQSLPSASWHWCSSERRAVPMPSWPWKLRSSRTTQHHDISGMSRHAESIKRFAAPLQHSVLAHETGLLTCTLTHRAENPGPLLPGLRMRLLLSSKLESDAAEASIAVLPDTELPVPEVPRVEAPRLEVPIADFPRPVGPVSKLASPVVVPGVKPARFEFLVPAYRAPSARTHHCHE